MYDFTIHLLDAIVREKMFVFIYQGSACLHGLAEVTALPGLLT